MKTNDDHQITVYSPTLENFARGSMKKILLHFFLIGCTILLMPVNWASARELWVDQKVDKSGNGSSEKPFQTIAEAINASKNEDIVTVKEGVYQEAVLINKSGTPEHPFTLRGAPGEKVVISGFSKVTGWTKLKGEIYTTTVDFEPIDLFVGRNPQFVSQDVPREGAWHQLESFEIGGETYKVTKDSKLKDATGDSMFLYGYVGTSCTDVHYPVKKTESASNLVYLQDKIGKEQWLHLPLPKPNARTKAADRFVICNHLDFISNPGEFAFEKIADNKTKLYFWPKQAEDLTKTYSRKIRSALVDVENVSYVRMEGLNVTGCAFSHDPIGAILSNSSNHLTITSCVVDNNLGRGIMVIQGSDVTISKCLSIQNKFGITLQRTHRALIEQNEVCYNTEDGVRLEGSYAAHTAGNNLPWEDPEFIRTQDVTVRSNYIHHQNYLQHPDGIQQFAVRRIRFEKNLIMFCGQGVMTEASYDLEFTNNVFLLDSWGINYGGEDARFYHNTFYLTFTGGIPLKRFANTQLFENIISQPINPAEGYYGDRNFIVLDGTMATQKQSGDQDAHTLTGNSPFKNVPRNLQMITHIEEGTTSHLFLTHDFFLPKEKQAPLSGFVVNDHVEINGDGILRTVKSVDGESITISPPLPGKPWRDDADKSFVANWGSNTNLQIDLRLDPASPAAHLSAEGGAVGSDIDIKAFQAGDFNGTGKRELPPIPEELKEAWPNPNLPVIPFLKYKL